MTAKAPRIRLPRAIWMLGFVSLLMDVSSELVHSLLPVFVVTTLGASTVSLGLMEGFAQGIAALSKMFSGAISDWLHKRKMLAVIGYGLSALTKPLFPLAQSVQMVFAARLIDRVGKGIRGAPRDALIGEIAPPELRGAAYGLRQSLDVAGAFVGPALAIGLMLLFANNIRAVYWFAVLPAFLCVALLIFGVQEPERQITGKESKFKINRREIANLGKAYWSVVLVGSLLTLARFSEAFLILRAQHAGLGETWLPLVLVVMSFVYSFSAYPAGFLSDRMDRRLLLLIGIGILIVADIVLALAASIWSVMIGIALWGLHMGFSQGLLATLIADTTQEERRGTAFGLFNFVSGFVLLAASAIAGYLWHLGGPKMTFLAGAFFTLIAFLGLLMHMKRKQAAVS